MLLQPPVLLHLTSSFLISTLRLHVEPERAPEQEPGVEEQAQTPLLLISPNRNVSLTLRGPTLLADKLPLLGSAGVWTYAGQGAFPVTALCHGGFGLRLTVGEAERTLPSPSFCANHGLNSECGVL